MSSVSASLLCKILTVFLLFCLTKANGGTCLSYGHSCWGGHGKRNGAANFVGAAAQRRTGSWYLSKLFNPSMERPNRLTASYINNPTAEEDDDKFQNYGYQVYPVLDATEFNPRDDLKDADQLKTRKLRLDLRDSDDEMVVLAPEVQHLPFPKYKFLQVMDRMSDKRVEN
ncbi:hypothetical protein RUM44_005274 [Polyplax serrata]|uniref:Uncharacterized protein n=1 Tax=Polyplax serrata TaxID=468196 RepID=A0ABR1AEJ3_POLSC